MNSYPPELLIQLAPVMFVAGLDHDVPPNDGAKRPQDPYTVLVLRLREALTTQRKVAVWQPERPKTFQVVLADKAVRFPPRKIHPQDDPSQPPRSPLSPQMPSSPLYPDGLIAPIWIRKHTTLVPSVFVLFLRLFESPSNPPRSPLDPPDPEKEKDKEKEERRRDTELSAEIAERKKSTNERGIKLTVVLMASRKMLDDPSLDARLTFIRRQSGLDSRAALFVLSPVSPTELNDFIRSLQQALFDLALEYYTSHSKRVRRKRNRHSQATAIASSSSGSSHAPSLGPASVGIARPLRPDGWAVRYEYKMASFAEFRGEDEVALKHYQDAYSRLLTMFGSTAVLPPRTKRWAEAKVLSDCISVKICKLYLYNAEHSLALAQFNAHLRRFVDLSRGWGIGEETFEYWSWMARQYRILAELLDQGTHSTLTIPTHLPIAQPPPTTAAQQQQPQQLDALRALGLNPSTALQHPGFYYYVAAGCAEQRRTRFLAMLDTEPGAPQAPGFTNEMKVDHFTIILELYTKAYELFKKHAPAGSQGQSSHGRLTLRIAYSIAQTYYASGKFDMAVRFFERISKTYRREHWGTVLRPLLSTWYACARQLGDIELSVRLLVEMLSYGDSHGSGSGGDAEEGESLVEDLLAVLKSTVPSNPNEPFVVDLAESEPIFDSTVVFWFPEVKVGEPAPFQICITAPPAAALSALPFVSLRLYYAEDCPPATVVHAPLAPGAQLLEQSVRRVDLGNLPVQPGSVAPQQTDADLRWSQGGMLVLTGSLLSDMPCELKFSKAVLTLQEGSWHIEIPIDLSQTRTGATPCPKWLSALSPPRFIPIRRAHFSSAIVQTRPHQLRVSFSHDAPTYLDEHYPIMLDIANTDDREFDVTVDILLQPGEDDSVNHIVFADQHSSGLIKGVALGRLGPGVAVCRTLQLVCTGAAGDRVLDVSVQSRAVSPSRGVSGPSSPTSPTSLQDTREALQTLVIPAVQGLSVTNETTYKRRSADLPGLSSLATLDRDYWDDSVGGEALVRTTLECVGPWSLFVESIKLLHENGKAKIIQSSLDDEDFPAEWLPGDQFCGLCRLSLAVDEDIPDETIKITGPGHYEVSWRRVLKSGQHGPLSTTRVPLPLLQPPGNGLIALLHVSPIAYLHTPLPLELTIRNQHPTRTAMPAVSLELSPADAFVVAGLRSGRLPILLPGEEEKVLWRLIPTECGAAVRLPRIRVTDQRNADAAEKGTVGLTGEPAAEGEEVEIVDVRWDGRDSNGTMLLASGQEATSSIIVLPSQKL